MTRSPDPVIKLSPPNPRDYLPAVINQRVVQDNIKHPGTLYPLVVGAGCGFVGWLFGVPQLFWGLAAGALLGPAWASFQIFLLKDRNARKYLTQLNKKQREYQRLLRERLLKQLGELRKNHGFREQAKQGYQQVLHIQEKLDSVNSLLAIKLDPNEMTYGRFQAAAEQVSLSVLDNLSDIVGILKSAGSIKESYIRERLSKLEKIHAPSPVDAAEIETLNQQLGLKHSQIDKVEVLLTKNETAMTEMEKISAAVAEWKSGERFSSGDFESTIARLQELAQTAHVYNL